MPRYSKKHYERQDLYNLFIGSVVSSGKITDGPLNWLYMNQGLKEQRYLLPRNAIPKSNWATNVLPFLSDIRFRVAVRMDRQSLQHISRLIQNDPVFLNRSNCEQAPIDQQLQCALYKLGHDGNASSFIQSASYWGVSEGHMHKTTSRVVEALCNLKDKVIEWPNEDEKRRESMKNDSREGFLGCVGKVDGTDIVLKYKPGGVYDGEIFFTRKKKYALDLCAVCDSSTRFIYILAGWPNSQHDARVYASTNLQRHPENYFALGEYLLGDAAYTNSSHLVSPYKSPFTNEKENRRFNRKLSRIRVDIEHAFGVLKG